MYHIFTFDNGQPAILYNENNSVILYVIANGRIINKGTIFNDVKSNFDIYGLGPYYIFYISTNNTIKTYTTSGQVLLETYTIPFEYDKEEKIYTFIKPLFYKEKLLFFHLNSSKTNVNEDAQLNLQITDLTTGIAKTLINNLPLNIHIDILNSDEQILIITTSPKHRNFYFLDEEYTLKKHVINDKKQFNKIKELEQALSSNELEIKNLKASRAHITNQYNELAEYAGKLQEELRKLRYMY